MEIDNPCDIHLAIASAIATAQSQLAREVLATIEKESVKLHKSFVVEAVQMPDEFLSSNSVIKDPIIIDPSGETAEQGWDACHKYVEQCGGLAYDDGEPNWRAAFGADPGCCSCPNCKQMFWAFGRVIRCTECGFEFPTDWWPMYSYGVSDAHLISGKRKLPDDEIRQRLIYGVNERMPKRIQHPYYKYGFEHPVESAWDEHDKLPWKEIMAGESTATRT
jgi:hypothetical protein